MTENNWVSYKNGNYIVAMDLTNGTKIRYNDLDFFKAEFPESADVKVTNKCSGGCSFCFVDGMMVATPNGEINISEIKIGDEVLSFNPSSQKIESKNVKKLFQHLFEGYLMKITLGDGKVIKCTPNHKFYVENKGYVEAKNLKEEDNIIDVY